jgi:glutamate dehydrogenase
MALKQALLKSPLPDEPGLLHYLEEYFPSVLRKRFGHAMGMHRLKREIIATQLTNRLVDRLGISFIHGMIGETGARPLETIRSILGTYEILNLEETFNKLLKVEHTVAIRHQYDAMLELRRCTRGVAQWLLFTGARIEDLQRFVEFYRKPLSQLRRNLENLLPAESERKHFRSRRKYAVDNGFPKDIANDLATTDYLPGCMGIIDITRFTGVPLEAAARSYYALGDFLQLGWLRDELGKVEVKGKWEAIALGGLIMELRHVQRQLTIEFLGSGDTKSPDLESFFAQQAILMRRIQHTVNEVKSQGTLEPAAASVINRLLLQLLRSLEKPEVRRIVPTYF